MDAPTAQVHPEADTAVEAQVEAPSVDQPRPQASSVDRSTPPIYRLPNELKTKLVSLLDPADGIRFAVTCREFGSWAVREVLTVDSRHGDRHALAYACKTGDRALAELALGLGASAQKLLPATEMSPLHLAVYHNAPHQFVQFLLDRGNLGAASINQPRDYQYLRGLTINELPAIPLKFTRSLNPLQMALIRGLGQDMFHNLPALLIRAQPVGGHSFSNAVKTATLLLNAGACEEPALIAPTDRVGRFNSPLVLALIIFAADPESGLPLVELVVEKGAFVLDGPYIGEIVSKVLARHASDGAREMLAPVMGRLGVPMPPP